MSTETGMQVPRYKYEYISTNILVPWYMYIGTNIVEPDEKENNGNRSI